MVIIEKGESNMRNFYPRTVKSFFFRTGVIHGTGEINSPPDYAWVEVMAPDVETACEIFLAYYKPAGGREITAGQLLPPRSMEMMLRKYPHPDKEHQCLQMPYPTPRIGLYWPNRREEAQKEAEQKAEEGRRRQYEAELHAELEKYRTAEVEQK